MDGLSYPPFRNTTDGHLDPYLVQLMVQEVSNFVTCLVVASMPLTDQIFFPLSGWILWPALAIMMSESILSISTVAFTTLYSPSRSRVAPLVSLASFDEETDDLIPSDFPEDDDDEAVEEEMDMRIIVGGVVLSCVSCVLLVGYVFGEEGIKWWATCLALGLASVFSILG